MVFASVQFISLIPDVFFTAEHERRRAEYDVDTRFSSTVRDNAMAVEEKQ